METVIAAAIGFVAALGTVWMQQRFEAKRTRAAAQERIAAAGTDRARQAAATCDRLFVELAKSVPELRRHSRMSAMTDEALQALTNQVHSALDEIETALVDLPEVLRWRVAAGHSYVRDCGYLGSDAFGGDCFHYDSSGAIARHACSDMHHVLTAFLRNETLPEPTDRMLEYAVAYDAYDADLESQFAEEIYDDRVAREKWLAQYPELAERLKERGGQPY